MCLIKKLAPKREKYKQICVLSTYSDDNLPFKGLSFITDSVMS